MVYLFVEYIYLFKINISLLQRLSEGGGKMKTGGMGRGTGGNLKRPLRRREIMD